MRGSDDLVDDLTRQLLDRPLHLAEGLPGRAYGEAFYRREQTHLFPRLWCPIGVGGRIPNPGDAMPVDLAGWPLVMVRGKDGEIRVFHNICRHRGMKLLTAPCTGTPSLRCPWHGWAYALDGRLVATPELGGEGSDRAAGFERAELGLKPVRAGRWLDYVFVNIDGTAPPLAEQMAPLDRLLAGRDHASLGHGGQWTHDYPGNWKLSIEGGVEDYHLPWGHKQLMQGVKARNGRIDVADGCFAANSMRIEADTTAVFEHGARWQGLPPIAMTAPAEADRTYVINVFPVGIMAVMRDHVMLGLFTPDGPARTRIEFDFYFVGAGATSPDFASARRAVIDGWAHVAQQDTEFVRNVQATCESRERLGLQTRFSPFWEGAVHHFQKMVLDAMSRP